MSLTYHDVMRADMSSLLDAADMWKKMGKRFGELHANYRDNVRTLTGEDGPWTGGGAAAFGAQSTKTLHEFIAAKKQANAVASLLEDAHSQFTTLRKKVEKERDDAVAAGMKVDENGYCTYDFSDYTSTEKRAAVQAGGLATEENNWTNKISAAVKELSDADHGVKLALEAVSKDRDGKGADGGFNSSAKGDVEKYEGLRAAELGMRLNARDELTQKQLQEFQRLNRDNSDNTLYSRTVLNSLGPEGTVNLSNILAFRAHADSSAGKQYLSLEKGLSAVLATATTVEGSERSKMADRQFRDTWLSEMKKIGVKEFEGPLSPDHQSGDEEQKVRGYQSILTLIENGNPEAYSPAFLKTLGQDVYEVELESKGNVWDLNESYAGKDMSWFANDPMDSALGLMAQHPDAATDFLDPGVGGENGKLDYFINERDWKGITPLYEEWRGNTSTIVEGEPTEDSDARRGFGAALEAAATGHEPLEKGERVDVGPHTPEQARVMQETVTCLDRGTEGAREGSDERYGEDTPENIRRNVARALADYAPDTYAILSEQGGNYSSPGGGGVWIDADGNAGINVDKGSLMRVMRGASEDAQSYALLYETNQRFAAQELGDSSQEISPGDKEWMNAAREAGRSIGVMNAIGADVIYDERNATNAWAADVQRYSYHGTGSLVTGIPFIGDVAQRSIDSMGYEWQEDITAAADEKAQAEGSRHYSAGITGTYQLFEEFAHQRDIPTTDKADPNYEDHPLHGEWKAARGVAREAYGGARADAESHLGWS